MLEELICALVEINEKSCRYALNERLKDPRFRLIELNKHKENSPTKMISFDSYFIYCTDCTIQRNTGNKTPFSDADIEYLLEPTIGIQTDLLWGSGLSLSYNEGTPSGIPYNKKNAVKIEELIKEISKHIDAKPRHIAASNYLNISLREVLNNLKVIKSIKFDKFIDFGEVFSKSFNELKNSIGVSNTIYKYKSLELGLVEDYHDNIAHISNDLHEIMASIRQLYFLREQYHIKINTKACNVGVHGARFAHEQYLRIFKKILDDRDKNDNEL